MKKKRRNIRDAYEAELADIYEETDSEREQVTAD
jgi:hypothetical protein